MNYGSFKSYEINSENNSRLSYGFGGFPINIKVGSLTAFANSDSSFNYIQGYSVTEVNKLISTMLTGWTSDNYPNVVKPKSMSDNYIELVLSCDSGFCVKKKLQFPHIVEWKDENVHFDYHPAYKEFSLDNWIKADDFATPDITLAMNPTDEIIGNGGNPSTANSGIFFIYYRNLPVGVNRIRIIFYIKTQTEPIEFDLEVKDGNYFSDVKNMQNANIFFKNVKEMLLGEYGSQPFEKIPLWTVQTYYNLIINQIPSNTITHDLFFYPYV